MPVRLIFVCLIFNDKEDQILYFTDRASKLKVVIHNGHE